MSSRSNARKSSGATAGAAAAAASPSPPRGPFVLPKDRPSRTAADDKNGAQAWCNWMCKLCTYKEAPEWSVHNNYIHTGYRDTSTFRGAIRSVLMIHNETANIWTHLVGLAIFVAITTSMVFGWGAAPMEALPATWITGGAFIWDFVCTELFGLFSPLDVKGSKAQLTITGGAFVRILLPGANATRVALVARTVQFRASVEASRLMLLDVASGLGGGGGGSAAGSWRNSAKNKGGGDGAGGAEEETNGGVGGGKDGERNDIDGGGGGGGSGVAAGAGSVDGGGSGGGGEGLVVVGGGGGRGGKSGVIGIGGVVGEGLDAATSALLSVASGLRRHLHLPDTPLAADARAALHASLDDARAKAWP